MVLRSGSRGRRRNITSHSAQGRAGQGRVLDERGHEKTAEIRYRAEWCVEPS